MTPGVRTLSVLVVDDDPEMRRYIQRSLERVFGPGTRVSEAGDGQDALRQLAVNAFDAVITDVLLPRLDGLALCEAVAAGLPVLVVSGELDAIERARGALRGRGDRAFLAKPFNGATLGATLARLLLPS